MIVNDSITTSSGYQTRLKTNSITPKHSPNFIAWDSLEPVSREGKRKFSSARDSDLSSKVAATASSNFGNAPLSTAFRQRIIRVYERDKLSFSEALSSQHDLDSNKKAHFEAKAADFLEKPKQILSKYMSVVAEASAILAAENKKVGGISAELGGDSRSIHKRYSDHLLGSIVKDVDSGIIIEQVFKVQTAENSCYAEIWDLSMQMRNECRKFSKLSSSSERVLKTPELVRGSSSQRSPNSAEKWKEELGEEALPGLGLDFKDVFSSP